MTKKIATVATVPPVLQLLLRGTVATVQNLKTKKSHGGSTKNTVNVQ